jgi:hypothetical protein
MSCTRRGNTWGLRRCIRLRYFLIDVENLDEAIAIAGRIPAARKGTIEIRPVFELKDLPSTSGIKS